MSNGDPVNGSARENPELLNLGRTHSGRTFVLMVMIVLAIAWCGIFLAFSRWKAQYREDKLFGEREVATTVDRLADLKPPGVDRETWTQAVSDSHAMLVVVTGSGILDRSAMTQLRDELRAQYAKTTAESAVNDLSELWDDMQARAGPILTRDPERLPVVPKRPKILESHQDTKAIKK